METLPQDNIQKSEHFSNGFWINDFWFGLTSLWITYRAAVFNISANLLFG